MKKLYDRFVHRNIFYHPHILVKPKQFITRSLRFWDNRRLRKARNKRSHVVTSVQGYAIYVDIFETKKNNEDIILLIHGHFSDKTEFNGLIPNLQKKGYDVAVYNVYGEWKPFSFPTYTYGKREKNDLDAVIQKLDNYERIHLVGHSLGAAIVAEYTKTFSNPKVCTMTMIALYETLDKAIDVGINQTPVPFFTMQVDASEHMKHFSKVENVDLYQQDMKELLKDVESNHMLIFGEDDERAPYFDVSVPTGIIPKAKHTSFFTTKKEQFTEMLNNHIKRHIPR